MADITPTVIAKNSSALLSLVAVNSSDSIVGATKDDVLEIKTGRGGSINVTFVAQIACDQGTLHDVVTAVAAGARRAIPMPIPIDRYLDVNKKVVVNYSGTTTVTAQAYRTPA